MQAHTALLKLLAKTTRNWPNSSVLTHILLYVFVGFDAVGWSFSAPSSCDVAFFVFFSCSSSCSVVSFSVFPLKVCWVSALDPVSLHRLFCSLLPPVCVDSLVTSLCVDSLVSSFDLLPMFQITSGHCESTEVLNPNDHSEPSLSMCKTYTVPFHPSALSYSFGFFPLLSSLFLSLSFKLAGFKPSWELLISAPDQLVSDWVPSVFDLCCFPGISPYLYISSDRTLAGPPLGHICVEANASSVVSGPSPFQSALPNKPG